MIIKTFRLLKRLGLLIFSLSRNLIQLLLIKILRKKIIIISLIDHLGDIIACEPVTRFLRKEHPNNYIIWFVKKEYRDVLTYNKNIDKVLTVSCLTEWILIKKLNSYYRIIDLHVPIRGCEFFRIKLNNKNAFNINSKNYLNFGSLLESFSLIGGLKKLDDAPIFHFNPEKKFINVAKNNIIIHCTANDKIKNWDEIKWNQLVAKLMHLDYNVTEIGFKNVIDIEDKKYYNLCNKINLQEIAYLIKHSILFIGIDSAFGHMANAVNTPGVILLGNFHNFKRYTPYSGKYTEREFASIIHYDGPVKEIPLEIVFQETIKRLVTIRNIF